MKAPIRLLRKREDVLEILTTYKNENNLTWTDVASQLGVSAATLTRWRTKAVEIPIVVFIYERESLQMPMFADSLAGGNHERSLS